MGEQQMDMQQQQMETDQTAAAGDDDVAVDPEHDKEVKKQQTAQSQYSMLSKKKNRTLSDEAKLKSASLTMSKNK
jgi:hypothetical protein